METVAEGVHRLGSRYVNHYLVDDGGSLTVIDAGMPGYYDAFLEDLAALGRSISDIRAIVLTHNHSDHIGFAERLRGQGPSVFVHELDAPASTGVEKVKTPTGRPRDLAKPGMLGFAAHALRNGGLGYAPVAEVTTYSDGEVLDVPGGLRVVFTPGHSPGHCALLLETRGVLFAGDGIVTGIPWTNETGPQLMKINADRDRALASLDIYETIEAAVLLPGHGDPWAGGVVEAARIAKRRASAA